MYFKSDFLFLIHMTQSPDKQPISYQDQLDKIAMKGFSGSQVIMIVGIGQELGIFDYLLKKSKNRPLSTTPSFVSFSLNELQDQLSLNPVYLEAWLQMAVECGIFEIDDVSHQTLRTAPYVFEMLVNRDDYLDKYVGFVIAAFYQLTSLQPFILQAFKTGALLQKSEESVEKRMMLQKNSARMGARVELVFSTRCKEYKKVLQGGGTLLEVGCGFGYNLETWARKYPKAHFVGIDIDAEATKLLQERVLANNWGERIEIVHASTKDYTQGAAKTFDVILLSHVLHELDPDEDYRKSVLLDIYALLKDDGVFIIADPLPTKIFTSQDTRPGQQWANFLRAFAQWNEVAYGARFYDKEGFQKLVASTPFKHVELLQETEHAIWVIKK